jgi:hypothetical protein
MTATGVSDGQNTAGTACEGMTMDEHDELARIIRDQRRAERERDVRNRHEAGVEHDDLRRPAGTRERGGVPRWRTTELTVGRSPPVAQGTPTWPVGARRERDWLG